MTVQPHPIEENCVGKPVTLSQNETESLCMKAARGAGFSWGLAEEAGVAAGWLAARNLDATPQMLAYLTQRSHVVEWGTPAPQPGHWRSTGPMPLCPITLGAALTDRARLVDGPFSRDTQFDPVAAPILLLPFLARAAQICGKPLVAVWPEGKLQIAKDGTFDRQAANEWRGLTQLAVKICTSGAGDVEQPKPCGLPPVSQTVLDGLSVLALRTTVPATDESRRGAGSTTTDND